MKNYKKGFVHFSFIVIGLIVFGIVAAGSAAIAYKKYASTIPTTPVAVTTAGQNPTATENNETRDWKIYWSQKYGFEFRFPSHLKIDKAEYPRLYLLGVCEGKVQGDCLGFSLQLNYSGEGPQSLDQMYISNITRFQSRNITYKESEVYIGNAKARKIEILNPESPESASEMLFVKGKVDMIITLSANGDKMLFNKILSTFKLTNKTAFVL